MKNMLKVNCNYIFYLFVGFIGRFLKLVFVVFFCVVVIVVWVGFGIFVFGFVFMVIFVFVFFLILVLVGVGVKVMFFIVIFDFFVNGFEIVVCCFFDCGYLLGGVVGVVFINGFLSLFIGVDRLEGVEWIWLVVGVDVVVERDGRLGVDLELVDMVDVGGVC